MKRNIPYTQGICRQHHFSSARARLDDDSKRAPFHDGQQTILPGSADSSLQPDKLHATKIRSSQANCLHAGHEDTGPTKKFPTSSITQRSRREVTLGILNHVQLVGPTQCSLAFDRTMIMKKFNHNWESPAPSVSVAHAYKLTNLVSESSINCHRC